MIEFDLKFLKEGTLNKYIEAERTNRFKGASIKKRLTRYCELVVRQEMSAGVEFYWPSKLEFKWYLPDMRIDPDNWTFTQKFIFDGMQRAKWNGRPFLENDGIKFIKGISHTYEVDRDRPRVEISQAKGTEI